MLEWAANNGKAVRQRTVRQEITMFKAGTLHLNMYATSGQPTEKITMTTMEHATVRLEEQNPEELEQESEYDTESESEMPATVDSDQEDEMTFLRAVTTRSGRTVRVASKLF